MSHHPYSMVPQSTPYQAEPAPTQGIEATARGGWDINAYIDPAVSGEQMVEPYDRRTSQQSPREVEHEVHHDDAPHDEDAEGEQDQP